MKLDIGCGTFKRDGFLGVDPHVDTDFQAPMWQLPFEDSSIEEIYSSHALEHIGKAQVVPTLAEWKRVIIPGGLITIQVPDLRWCCEQWLRRQSNDWYLDIIFGGQGHEGEFHRTGYTPELMHQYVAQAGLFQKREEVIESHGQPTLQFLVTK